MFEEDGDYNDLLRHWVLGASLEIPRSISMKGAKAEPTTDCPKEMLSKAINRLSGQWELNEPIVTKPAIPQAKTRAEMMADIDARMFGFLKSDTADRFQTKWVGDEVHRVDGAKPIYAIVYELENMLKLELE